MQTVKHKDLVQDWICEASRIMAEILQLYYLLTGTLYQVYGFKPLRLQLLQIFIVAGTPLFRAYSDQSENYSKFLYLTEGCAESIVFYSNLHHWETFVSVSKFVELRRQTSDIFRTKLQIHENWELKISGREMTEESWDSRGLDNSWFSPEGEGGDRSPSPRQSQSVPGAEKLWRTRKELRESFAL